MQFRLCGPVCYVDCCEMPVSLKTMIGFREKACTSVAVCGLGANGTSDVGCCNWISLEYLYSLLKRSKVSKFVLMALRLEIDELGDAGWKFRT